MRVRGSFSAKASGAAFVAVCAGAAACASILGIDDRLPDTGDGAAPDATADAGDSGHPQGDGPIPDVVTTTDGGDAGGPCPPDTVCTLATGLNHPYEIAIDSTAIYWTNYGTAQNASDGTVMKCALDGCGGNPTTLASGLTNPEELVVDATSVYWVDRGSSQVLKCGLSGCNNTPVILASGQSVPLSIAVDATYVYWVDNGDSTIRRASKTDGSGAVVLANADGGVNSPGYCAIDSNFFYYDDNAFNDFIGRVPLAGGAVTAITAAPTGCPCFLDVDTANVYFTAQFGGFVGKTPKTSADAASVVVASAQNTPISLKLDPAKANIYWINNGNGNGDGVVRKIAVGGGNPTTLAPNQSIPSGIAVDSAYVYWMSNGTVDDAGGVTPSTGALFKHSK